MPEIDLMERAMAAARMAAAELVEKRVKGMQRVIARKDREITELRERLAAYEPEEEPTP